MVSGGIIALAMAIAGFNVYAANYQEDATDDSSILLAFLGSEEDTLETVTSNLDSKKSARGNDRFSIVSVASATASTPTLLTASVVSSNDQGTEQKQDLAVVGDNTLVKNSPTDTTVSYKPRTDVIRYTVKEGETITGIAKKFGVDAATILKESDKYADDIIKPGEKLTILPVSGTTERVDKGETLTGIANKHDADLGKIMDYNKLVNATDIEEGQILIIPDGKREIKMRPQPTIEEPDTSRTQLAYRSSTTNSNRTTNIVQSTPTVNKGPRVGNRFPYGWCTWYAAQARGDVTWRGNAGQWLNNARAQGRATGRVPAKGAILVTSESWWGHVAIVESVQGDKVTISEMNYQGFGVVSKRTISNKSGVIKGYIY